MKDILNITISLSGKAVHLVFWHKIIQVKDHTQIIEDERRHSGIETRSNSGIPNRSLKEIVATLSMKTIDEKPNDNSFVF